MIKPTTDGWLALLGAVALGAVALWSGNNALLLVATPVWAVLLLAIVLGFANVRGLALSREWPDELVAGRSGRGAVVVVRARGTSRALRLADEGASVTVPLARGRTRVPCAWRFGERGPTVVRGFAVRSTWPFGLVAHERFVTAPDRVLVGVRPQPGAIDEGARQGDGRAGHHGRTGTGELVGLRGYRPGDPLRRVHWPTSARVGAPMVVERTEDEDQAVIVTVEPRSTSSGWERELSRAAGSIQRAVRQGRRVGLVLPERGPADEVEAPGRDPARAAVRFPARSGEGWRRHLLDVLARLPRVSP